MDWVLLVDRALDVTFQFRILTLNLRWPWRALSLCLVQRRYRQGLNIISVCALVIQSL